MLQVTYGDSPVINANIEVNITVRMNNGSVARVNNLTMLDNGYGGKCHLSHACRAASKLRAKHEMGKTIPYILFSVTITTIGNLTSLLPCCLRGEIVMVDR